MPDFTFVPLAQQGQWDVYLSGDRVFTIRGQEPSIRVDDLRRRGLGNPDHSYPTVLLAMTAITKLILGDLTW